MRRCNLFLVASALWIALGGCGDCCLNENECRPPSPEPGSCVWTRAEPTQADLGDGCQHDDHEPNGSMPMAAVSRIEHECGDTSKVGNIADEDDVDVFRTGTCAIGGGIIDSLAKRMRPWVDVDTDEYLRVCIFPTCHGGSTNVYRCIDEDPDGFVTSPAPAMSPTFFRGCCRVGRGRITAEMDCPMYSAEVDTYFWVDGGEGGLSATCAPYTLHWQLN